MACISISLALKCVPKKFYVTKFHLAVNDNIMSLCTSGFLDVNESTADLVALPDSSLPYNNPLHYFTQWIFPNLNFTCNANIISWRLRVNDSTDLDLGNIQGLRSIPQIAIWRLQNSFGDSYILHSITNDSQASVIAIEAGVYEYTPSQPVSVQTGDIIGITMPPNDDERMTSVRPLFLKLSGEGNSSTTVSCTRLGDSQYFFLADGMCLNQQEQQSFYIPLLTAITDGQFYT